MDFNTNPAFSHAETPAGRVVMVRSQARSGRACSFYINTGDGAHASHHARRPARGRARSRAHRLLAGRGGAL